MDIDYEYHYDSQDAQDFLNDITVGLKTTLPPGQNIITHAPMEPDAEQGTDYYNILKINAAYLDFLLPQYYNGYTRPAIDGLSDSGSGSRPNALPNYNTLVNDMFGGDATKVVFGFCVSLSNVLVIFYFFPVFQFPFNTCSFLSLTRASFSISSLYVYITYFHVQISDCSGTGSNASGQQAASVMTQLHSTHACNGGAFFWVGVDSKGGFDGLAGGASSWPYIIRAP